MQKKPSHTKIPSEQTHNNQYYVMPQSTRKQQYDDYSFRKVVSSRNTDCYDNYAHSEILIQQQQPYTTYLELQRALHQSEFNYQQLSLSNQQLQSNLMELQTMYNKSEINKQQLQNQILNYENKLQYKENELKQALEMNTQYLKEIASYKVKIQNMNKSNNTLQEDNQQNQSNQQNSIIRKDNFQLNLNGSLTSLSQRIKSQETDPQENVTNQYYANQIQNYQQQIQDKNLLIVGLQQQIKNLTDFQRQLMQRSPKKKNQKLGQQEQSSPQQTPIPKVQILNDSHVLSNQNLLNLIDIQSKRESTINKTRQSDEYGQSIKSSITNTKSKVELQQIYKKINQSTIYTAGLYSSLLDYQYLSNNIQSCKLLSNSNSKDCLQNITK